MCCTISILHLMAKIGHAVHFSLHSYFYIIIEPRHEISNKVVCATSKGADQPVQTLSLIRAFASHLNINVQMPLSRSAIGWYFICDCDIS